MVILYTFLLIKNKMPMNGRDCTMNGSFIMIVWQLHYDRTLLTVFLLNFSKGENRD